MSWYFQVGGSASPKYVVMPVEWTCPSALRLTGLVLQHDHNRRQRTYRDWVRTLPLLLRDRWPFAMPVLVIVVQVLVSFLDAPGGARENWGVVAYVLAVPP